MSRSSLANKSHLRQQLRQRRQGLNAVQRNHYARDIARQFMAHPEFKSAAHIGLYLAADGEADPMPIARRLWRQGKRIYLPSIQPERQLCFKQYQPGSRMLANQYRINEPISGQRSRIAAELDLLIIPLVAFDKAGNRLGMGGGYYDRHLAYRTSSPRAGPLLVGLAYEFQCQPGLDRDSWDIPLDLIVSEKQVYDARPYSRKRR